MSDTSLGGFCLCMFLYHGFGVLRRGSQSRTRWERRLSR